MKMIQLIQELSSQSPVVTWASRFEHPCKVQGRPTCAGRIMMQWRGDHMGSTSQTMLGKNAIKHILGIIKLHEI